MLLEKIGRGILREAFWREGECFVSRKRGEIRKYWSWKIQVNIGVFLVNSNLGPSRIAVFEDCKATDITTQPPWLDVEFFLPV